MVVPVDSPIGANCFEGIGEAIAIVVADAGNLRALGQVEPTGFPEHPEGFMESLGEFFPCHFGEVVAVGTRADPEVAAAGSDRDILIGHEGDGADFHDLTGR